MNERIDPSSSYVDRASLGEKDLVEQLVITGLADEIAGKWIFNPRDDPERRGVNDRAKEIVKSVSGTDVDSVGRLKGIFNHGGSEEKKEAGRVLNQLAGAVFLVMSGDDALKDRIPSGGAKVDEVLPRVWRGLGEKVVGNLIKSEKLMGILKNLDRARRATKGKGEGLEKAVRGAFLKLSDVDFDVEPGCEDELEVVMAYLDQEAERLEMEMLRGQAGGGGDEGEKGVEMTEELIKKLIEVASSKGGVGEIPPFLAGKDVDPVAAGAWQAMQGIEGSVGPLRDTSRGGIDDWMFRILDEVGREPLAFAGVGWQQVIPYMERALRKTGLSEKRLGEEIGRVRAFALCIAEREIIMHSDGDLNNFVERQAPPGLLPELQWDKPKAKEVSNHPVIREIRSWILKDAYSKKGGEIAKRLESRETMNEWAEYFADKILSDKDTVDGFKKVCKKKGVIWSEEILKQQISMAIAYFVVDDYPKWALWACRGAEMGREETEWMNEGRGVKLERKVDAENVGTVVCYSAKLGDLTGVDHPLVSLRRPVDLIRFKGGWDETILKVLEHALLYLSVDKWGKGAPVLSEIGVKDLSRWNALLSAIIGGPRGDILDNFDDLMKGIDKMVDMEPNREDRGAHFGYIAGEIVFAKVKALLSGVRGQGFVLNLAKALAIETSSIPKEKEQAAAALAGSGFSAQYGQIKEIVDRLGLDFGASPNFKTALDMLVTEIGDEETAPALADFRKGLLMLFGAGRVLFGGDEKKKRR